VKSKLIRLVDGLTVSEERVFTSLFGRLEHFPIFPTVFATISSFPEFFCSFCKTGKWSSTSSKLCFFSQRKERAETTGGRADSVRRAGELHRRATGCRQSARRQPAPQQSATGNSLIFMDKNGNEPLARKTRQSASETFYKY